MERSEQVVKIEWARSLISIFFFFFYSIFNDGFKKIYFNYRCVKNNCNFVIKFLTFFKFRFLSFWCDELIFFFHYGAKYLINYDLIEKYFCSSFKIPKAIIICKKWSRHISLSIFFFCSFIFCWIFFFKRSEIWS